MPTLFEAMIDERLEQFERHLLGQAALMQFQFRTHHKPLRQRSQSLQDTGIEALLMNGFMQRRRERVALAHADIEPVGELRIEAGDVLCRESATGFFGCEVFEDFVRLKDQHDERELRLLRSELCRTCERGESRLDVLHIGRGFSQAHLDAFLGLLRQRSHQHDADHILPDDDAAKFLGPVLLLELRQLRSGSHRFGVLTGDSFHDGTFGDELHRPVRQFQRHRPAARRIEPRFDDFAFAAFVDVGERVGSSRTQSAHEAHNDDQQPAPQRPLAHESPFAMERQPSAVQLGAHARGLCESSHPAERTKRLPQIPDAAKP